LFGAKGALRVMRCMYCESEYERRVPSEQSSMVEVQQSKRNEFKVMCIGVVNDCKREVGRLVN
jgi:hypothetical protein